MRAVLGRFIHVTALGLSVLHPPAQELQVHVIVRPTRRQRRDVVELIAAGVFHEPATRRAALAALKPQSQPLGLPGPSAFPPGRRRSHAQLPRVAGDGQLITDGFKSRGFHVRGNLRSFVVRSDLSPFVLSP